MKCPSCGYLTFGPIPTCPKCGEPLKEIAEEAEFLSDNTLMKEDTPEEPPADRTEGPGQAAGPEPVMVPQETSTPVGPPPGSHDGLRGGKREWSWDEFTPPEVKRPRVDIPSSRPPQAPAGLRFASGVIDHAFILSLTLGLTILSIALIGQDMSSLDFIGILPPVILFLFVIDGVYFTLFHGPGASTLGEAVFGIVLVSSDGRPLTFSRAFFRWVSSLVSSASFGLGLFWGWHDKITQTYIARKV